MNDRELLEKAAKAAGYTPEGYVIEEGLWLNDGNADYGYDYWNPIADDGDALRLAAEAGLIVDFWNERVIDGVRFGEGHRDWIYAQDHDGSMNRAITHAAAMSND